MVNSKPFPNLIYLYVIVYDSYPPFKMMFVKANIYFPFFQKLIKLTIFFGWNNKADKWLQSGKPSIYDYDSVKYEHIRIQEALADKINSQRKTLTVTNTNGSSDILIARNINKILTKIIA